MQLHGAPGSVEDTGDTRRGRSAVQPLTLPLTSQVTLSKSDNLSEPSFHHLFKKGFSKCVLWYPGFPEMASGAFLERKEEKVAL